ncbi:uncharacterized protein FIBRA_03302 [Fibroporia radiculosa]|uniref:Coupling of ubiquitin conjugation to ER degradation protein 1 n=1 Tax=Fibroporia radiculosa TaxID=599839 RepID=J4G4Y4_9APHY|nr:uncharacterized protein FIBRA_03302 [Fibroporia radiculosa]CCM01253.1 predicted protein [Fibroporia radiculosa]
MGEVVNVIVAVAVIVFIVRWATSGKDESSGPSPSSVLGFKPRNVTIEMVETVHNMFPDIPSDNIRYDLLRTGNVQQTTNTILERGFLPAPPPAYYTIYPRAVDQVPAANQPNAANVDATTSHAKSRAESLISRYNLQERVAVSSGISSATPEEACGKTVWEDSAEKREANLRERKARMILAARERLLAQQAGQASTSS